MITKDRGFSFIELVIILFILAILLYLAFNVYQDSIRTKRRGEAIQSLLSIASLEERYKSIHGAYGSLENVWKGPAMTPQQHYGLSLVLTETGFTVTASARGRQESDAVDTTSCNSLMLSNSKGVVIKTPSVCWE